MAPRELSAAVARFGALLRRNRLPVTLVQLTDGVSALDHLDLGDRREIYLGLRAIFVGRVEEFPTFERCFEDFWRAEPREEDLGLMAPAAGDAADAAATLETSGQRRKALALETWGDEEADAGGEPLSVPAASDREALATQDFSTFGAEQLEEVFRLTILIARRLARRISRRRRPVRRRGRVDLRRTLRANLTRGDLIDLRYRERKYGREFDKIVEALKPGDVAPTVLKGAKGWHVVRRMEPQ